MKKTNLLNFMLNYYKVCKINHLTKLKNKVIVITGASGLIGSNLVSFLSYLNNVYKLNIKIVAIIKSGIEPWFEKSKFIKYIKQDLSQKKISSNIKFDYLIHAATYAQPKKFLQYPQETVLLNIKTLFDLLDLCKKNRAKMLFLSSAEIYGEADNKHIPTREDYFGYVNTLSDRAIYAESKRLAETICFSYSKSVDIIIARVLLTYGPGVKYNDQRVISEFIKRSQNNKTLIMMDSGFSFRTFCFVSDLMEMLVNVLINGKSMVYNLCGNETIKIRSLAKKIAKINSAKLINAKKNHSITGTPNKTIISNDKYKSEFSKKNFINLTNGLTATSNWFQLLKNEYQKN